MEEFSKLNREQMRKITGGVVPVYVCNIGASCYQGLSGGTHILMGTCTDSAAPFVGCFCQGEGGTTRTDFCLTEGEVV